MMNRRLFLSLLCKTFDIFLKKSDSLHEVRLLILENKIKQILFTPNYDRQIFHFIASMIFYLESEYMLFLYLFLVSDQRTH